MRTASADAPIDPIPSDSRLTALSFDGSGRPALEKWYDDAVLSFWTPNEVRLDDDVIDYTTKLTPGERRFINHILAFFATADGIVNINLAERFRNEVKIIEATRFYNFQMTMEDIHATMYSVLLKTLVTDPSEQRRLIDAVHTMPIIAEMSRFMFDCIGSDAPFAERLLRMACVEGIFFTGCFCAIYWLCARGLMTGLGKSNEFIARDEALHTLFAMYLYTLLRPDCKLTAARVIEIVQEAVAVAVRFIREALPTGLMGMNADLMIPYIQCQADNLVHLIGIAPIYGTRHSFDFMEQINLTGRTNFFERKTTDYHRVSQPITAVSDVATDF